MYLITINLTYYNFDYYMSAVSQSNQTQMNVIAFTNYGVSRVLIEECSIYTKDNVL